MTWTPVIDRAAARQKSKPTIQVQNRLGFYKKNSPEAGIVGKKCVSSLIMYTNLKNLHFSKSETGLQISTKNPWHLPWSESVPRPRLKSCSLALAGILPQLITAGYPIHPGHTAVLM